jgi:hypothetical protein
VAAHEQEEPVISEIQIKWLRKHAEKIGSSRLQMICTEAFEAINTYGLRAADLPIIKAIGKELPAQMALDLGHNFVRQGTSCECTRCGLTGSIIDNATGLRLNGAIFTERCV